MMRTLLVPWEATAVLEALGASEAVLFSWSPLEDRVRLSGAATALCLGPAAPECPSAAIRALVQPSDRARIDALLEERPPGTRIAERFAMRGGPALHWRGVWLEEERRAAGLAVRAESFEARAAEPLTGLLPRAEFLSRLSHLLEGEGEFELAIADLARLRRFNEALGPDRADLLLAALGSRLSAAYGADALLGRTGDDEFAAFTPASGGDPADRLRSALERPMRVAGFDIFPAFAIGAAAARAGPGAPGAGELIRRTELALEAAKAQGLGSTAAYGKALEGHALSRLTLEADLRGALGRGEIVPYYQPIVRLASCALSGFEALARWRHPRKGLIAPDDFLPLLAEMGLMGELGRLMRGSAARQLAAWRSAHPAMGPMTVAVNLSVGEIDEAGLLEEVAALLVETGLPPGALKLEITESDIMRDPDRAAEVLAALRRSGAALALDDFGTGFSSLSYLSRLPFDTLKIDRYFVRTMASNEGSATIVRSVIELGQALSLEVVAEGVENAVMAAKLLALGCDYGQGFGYAPALSDQEAEVYLNESYADGAAPVKARG